MAKKLSGWKTGGMNRDLSVSAFNPEFAFENMNLRLAANDGNTTLSWVNEKGTASINTYVPVQVAEYWSKDGEEDVYVDPQDESWTYHPVHTEYNTTTLQGSCLGTAVLNKYLVLFMTTGSGATPDYIYRLEYNDDKTGLIVKELFHNNLGFDIDHPIETLVSYESENIQKVYWTDGINQTRLINIAPDNDGKAYTNTSFDFVTTLQLNEEIKVKKILGGGGMFAPGVIQYAFTYYNKYGQESNIFYTTPLYYISYADRGASPEDKVDNTFKITVEHVDTNFDYLRIYSIQRTSINGTPICKRVQDIEIASIDWIDDTDHSKGKKATSYIDTGYNGNYVDPTELLYKGGNDIIVGTIEQKDNTLFMGDITTPQNKQPAITSNDVTIENGTRTFYPTVVSSDNYEYANQLTSYDTDEKENSVPCAGFKFGNKYRCGVQFQDKTGKWTDPILIDDVEVKNEVGSTVDIRPKIVTTMLPDDEGAKDITVTIKITNNCGHVTNIKNKIYFNVGTETLECTLGNLQYITLGTGITKTYANVTIHNGGSYIENSVSILEILFEDVNGNTSTIGASFISQTPTTIQTTDPYEISIDDAPEKQPEPEPTPEPESYWSKPYPNPVNPAYLSGTGWRSGYGDGGVSTPDGIRLIITNTLNERVQFSGKLKLYVHQSGSSDLVELAAYLRPGDRYEFWMCNPYILDAGGKAYIDLDWGTNSWNNTALSPQYLPDKDGWIFQEADTIHVPAIKLGHCIIDGIGETKVDDNPFIVHVTPISGSVAIQRGQIYNLNIDSVDKSDGSGYNTSTTYPPQTTPSNSNNDSEEPIRSLSVEEEPEVQTEELRREVPERSVEVVRETRAVIDTISVTVPVLKGSISESVITSNNLRDKYVKVRPVVVFPEMQDRQVVCQGIVNPTMYTDNHRGNDDDSTKDLFAQSSWFFRPFYGSRSTDGEDIYQDVNYPSYKEDTWIEYREKEGSPERIKKVEIQGNFNARNRFKSDWRTLTFHSPDIEFDDSMLNLDYSASVLSSWVVGHADFLRTLSDIDIQTSTPTISQQGSGFVKKSFVKDAARGIISGLFWDDYFADDDTEKDKAMWFGANDKQKASGKWMVYLWNKSGALNNDMDRPADCGIMSAELKKKIISNLRFASVDSNVQDASPWLDDAVEWSFTDDARPKFHLFSSDQDEIIKLNTGNTTLSNIYKGNVDTLLMPDLTDGMYYALSLTPELDNTQVPPTTVWKFGDSPSFTSKVSWKLWGTNSSDHGLYYYDANNDSWNIPSGGGIFTDPGDDYLDIVSKKGSVRMKYKSTPHLVLVGKDDIVNIQYIPSLKNYLPIVELRRDVSSTTIFGGTSMDAQKQNIWIPCGEPVRLDDLTTHNEGEENEYQSVDFEYSWGDTYYQRYDCLKTYAFTPEDINQVVEIGSFMLETYVNIDGRYDRNRGQLSNLYMSPQNFNLINPVYSQLNNFFTYRIQDEDAYKEKKFPNQITWSKTKTSGADVDLWTNVTLASVLEMDGDKGSVRKLVRFNNNLFCFQDKGIAQVLYNDRVQINTQDGVPIEISNSDKVQGKNYFSDSVGCSNKWSMAQTPSGIYFMDSINKAIFMFNGQLNNLSGSLGFNSWAKENIPMCNPDDPEWTPEFPVYNSKSSFVSYYDKQNQDILFINEDTALAYSEKLGAFTSFYDYGNSAYFCNLQDTGIWVRKADSPSPTLLWKHQAGLYSTFFGVKKPYWMTLIGNPEPQTDKIFTNIEFRAIVEDDGEVVDDSITFYRPFDSIEAWDEYQHGLTSLTIPTGHNAFKHPIDNSTASLKRKFRIWRCDIPRDNVSIVTTQPELPENPTPEQQAAYDAAMVKYNQYLNDVSMGILRYKSHPNDRMRNTWLYLKLMSAGSIHKTEIHDIVMTYFA